MYLCFFRFKERDIGASVSVVFRFLNVSVIHLTNRLTVEVKLRYTVDVIKCPTVLVTLAVRLKLVVSLRVKDVNLVTLDASVTPTEEARV